MGACGGAVAGAGFFGFNNIGFLVFLLILALLGIAFITNGAVV